MDNDRKRPRKLDPEEAVNSQLTNHPNLYFEDGNVIMKTGNTLFCVHRTILSKHSTVFRDLFAQNAETLRGLPSFTLDNGKDDMESLLNTVYDGMHIDFPTLTVESFPTVAGLLRIVTKYQIQRPRTAIIEWLQIQWPSSLEKHDEKQAAVRERPLQQQHQEGDGVAENFIVHPAGVIGLLRECNYNNPKLLTPLFYDLSTKVWQFEAPFTGYHITPLSSADKERLIVGINKLRSLQIQSFACPTVTCLRHPPTEQRRLLACQTELLRMWHNVASAWMVKDGDHCQPVEDWAGMVAMIRTACNVAATARDAQKDALCASCCNSVVATVEQSRRTIWNSLTGLFGLTQ